MPTYLLHGFRWPRPLIRIHIILQNIDDAAAEWLCSPTTTSSLLHNFQELFPEAMPYLPSLRFIEQYDPNDLSAASISQPFAYVADVVEEVKLGVDIDEVRGKGVSNDQWGALMEVRDRLAPDEKVGWWVVVCGDEERWAPPVQDLTRGGFAINQTHGLGEPTESEREGLGIRGGGGEHIDGYANGNANGSANGYKHVLGRKKQAHHTDPALRELRDQIGYRTDSDASDESIPLGTRRTTSQDPRMYDSPRVQETPRMYEAPRVLEKPQVHETPRVVYETPRMPDSIETPPMTQTSPPSPKMSGVRKWLSKRKSQKSMRELAKAQSKDQAPPVPSTPRAR